MEATVVRPGEGRRVGNIEFSEDTPRFNLGVITTQPRREGPGPHEHAEEDDSFYILEGELTFLLEATDVVAVARGRCVVPWRAPLFANRGDAVVRMLNIHVLRPASTGASPGTEC